MFHFFVPVKTFEIIRHFETGRTLIYPELNLGFLLIILNCRLVDSSKISGIAIYNLIIFSDEICRFCDIMPTGCWMNKMCHKSLPPADSLRGVNFFTI